MENDLLIVSIGKLEPTVWEIITQNYNAAVRAFNTREHIECFLKLVEKNTDEIRAQLSKMRTYQRLPWTCEENETQRNYILEHYDEVNWEQCSKELKKFGGRSAQECAEHYELYFMPWNHRRWTKEEDNLLEAKHSEFEEEWNKIALFFWGRSPIQLEKRYNRLSGKTPPAKDWVEYGKCSQPHNSDLSENEDEEKEEES
jgi:hypothetical protein